MRYLIVPEDINLIDEMTGEPLKQPDGSLVAVQTFKAFVIRTLLNDPEQFGKNADQLEQRAHVRDQVKASTPGSLLALESADWESLKAAAQSPGTLGQGGVVRGYMPSVGTQILPFIKAIKDAAEKKPELALVAEPAIG